MSNIVFVSGGMDPVHCGHIRMINDAARAGRVVVVLNSDEWLVRKKGYAFMPWHERKEILMNLRNVYDVVAVDDSDGTVCEALRAHLPDFFANGGDRGKNNTPEQDVCDELGIKMLWGVGGVVTRYGNTWQWP